MLAYLKGKITEITETLITIEVEGIGYDVYMPYNFITTLSLSETQNKIYIYEHIKEDAHDLYGFMNKEQKELFKKLISVSGIGPKGGLNILNNYTPSEIIEIIVSQDSKALSKVSGIGPKIAQRIILELKGSIGNLQLLELTGLPIEKGHKGDIKNEAIEALVALGYSEYEAKKAVQAIFDHTDDVESIIKKALTLLMI